ncbi:peptide deformylase [Methylococcus geothermalis]|uniref:Peptide deformylase n=1 Tax=Methylococcus geothermalis TaxID=2681310 RepID=A0A858Q5R5_9GAMM|nr:peptide deformylase [Methylococcus geothermalis]
MFPARPAEEATVTILSILEFPDERLRKKAAPVEVFDDALRRTIDDMFETMYAAPGVGLAATQVNVHKRVLVIDVSEEKSAPLCLINPELLEKNGSGEMEEGCLSVPGIFEKVSRADSVRVRAQDRHGDFFEMSAEGLLAVCIQHEMDHLEGKLFLDHLSALKRQMARKKLQKERRMKEINKAPRAAAAV